MRTTRDRRPAALRRAAAAVLLGATALATAAPAAVAAPAAATTMLATGSTSAGQSLLQSGQSLQPGQSLVNGEMTLIMQDDGNLVLYLVGPSGNHGPALWNSGTYGNPGAYAVMQADGNFVVYRQGRSDPAGALWSSSTWGNPGSNVGILNDTLSVEGMSGVHWQGYSNTLYGDTVTGMMSSKTYAESASVWLVMQADGNLVLYRKRDGAVLWASGTWNHPGAYAVISGGRLTVSTSGGQLWSSQSGDLRESSYLKVQDDANVVVYLQGRSDPGGAIWSTGTWGRG
ncbi:hypothetical protein [Kitasatospora sp. NBC_01302]|uniref:hypothetical protein n=1 Tax=Kitasatospora sp. NBC_01302 TaxID=2903575 RepID=UPI002E149FAA|nr:hypothetical protein OG294_13055 [Kitasatospora sp. NBC_01302]